MAVLTVGNLTGALVANGAVTAQPTLAVVAGDTITTQAAVNKLDPTGALAAAATAMLGQAGTHKRGRRTRVAVEEVVIVPALLLVLRVALA